MNNELRDNIVNLNVLLKDVFGEERRISSILKAGNFSQEQVAYLQGEGLYDFIQSIDFALRVYLISYLSISKNCEILYQRYGLFGYKKQTLENIGTQYGVSRERIRQIQVKTIRTLKKDRLKKILIVAACRTLNINAFDMPLDNIWIPEDECSAVNIVYKKKYSFLMTAKMLSDYVPADTSLSISEFVKRLNNLKADNMKKLKKRTVTDFLINAGLLEEYTNSVGILHKRPTALGLSFGIFTEEHNAGKGTNTVTLYNPEAQKYLIDNIEAIVRLQEEDASKAELQGTPWKPDQDECLVDLFQKNASVAEIAVALKRTPVGIRARLKRLGLIEHRSDAE